MQQKIMFENNGELLQVTQNIQRDQGTSAIDRVVSNVPDEKAAHVTAYVAGIKVPFFIDSGA